MGQLVVSLSNFLPQGDYPINGNWQFSVDVSSVYTDFAHVTSAKMMLNNIAIYPSTGAYLTFNSNGWNWLGRPDITTAVFAQNGSTHSREVDLTTIHDGLLKFGSKATFTIHRVSGTGNTMNIRGSTTGTITVNYETTPRPIFYRHIDTWLRATPYGKVGGVWKENTPYVKAGGIWKEIIGGWG